MSGATDPPRAFRLVVSPAGPRFLGLSVPERNRRVARRIGASDDPSNPRLATLTVPDGMAITPAVAAGIPESRCHARLHWQAGRPPLEWHDPCATSPGVVDIQLPDGSVLDVSTLRARHRSSWTLLQASGKPRDGWLSRNVHRKVSRIFSYLFLLLGLSAHAATLFAFALGVAGAWFIGQTTHQTMMLGALLYWAASVADGIDGEMARLTLSESAFGEQLDTSVDLCTHMLALAGAGVGWWRQGFGAGGVVLALVVALGTPTVLLWGMTMVRRAHNSPQFVVVLKHMEVAIVRAAQDTGSAVLRLAASVFVLFRRESIAALAFAASLATGLRVVYPALVASGLAIVVVTLLMYRAAIDRALRVGVRP